MGSSSSSHAACVAQVNTGALSNDGGAGVALSGDRMYIAGGHGLAVFDLSDPALPKRIGDVIETGVIRSTKDHGKAQESARLAAELALVGSTLFVAGNKGLAVFDVSDPDTPQRIRQLDTGAIAWSSEAALAVRANFLYIAGGKGLAVFDISDPTSPKLVRDVIDTTVLSFDGGAAILFADTVDSDMPISSLNCCVGGSSTAMPIMYVAGGKGIAVFDVSKPEAPRKVGESIDSGALSSSCAGATMGIQESTLYVAGGKGLAVLDISNPLEPQRIGDVIDTGAISYQSGAALAFVGCEDATRTGTMLVAGGKGLRVFSLANPRQPEEVGNVIETGALSDPGGSQLVLYGPHVYVIGGNGLVVLDPVKLGALEDAAAPPLT